jgi:hypothetical protein
MMEKLLGRFILVKITSTPHITSLPKNTGWRKLFAGLKNYENLKIEIFVVFKLGRSKFGLILSEDRILTGRASISPPSQYFSEDWIKYMNQ